MINGFLLAYMCITLPVFAWGLWRATRDQNENKETEISNEAIRSIEVALSRALGPNQVVSVQQVPKTAAEAVMLQGRIIIEELRAVDARHVAWLKDLRIKLEENKQDMNAVMSSMQAVTKAILEMDSKATPDPEKAIKNFVHSLEYARDVFAKSQAQRKAVEGIISNVKVTHATK